MTLFEAIEGLTQYAVDTELIQVSDKVYCRNRVLELLNIVTFEKSDVKSTNHFDCLKVIVEYAARKTINVLRSDHARCGRDRLAGDPRKISGSLIRRISIRQGSEWNSSF